MASLSTAFALGTRVPVSYSLIAVLDNSASFPACFWVRRGCSELRAVSGGHIRSFVRLGCGAVGYEVVFPRNVLNWNPVQISELTFVSAMRFMYAIFPIADRLFGHVKHCADLGLSEVCSSP